MEYRKEKLETYITQIRGISYNPTEIFDKSSDDLVPILKANNITENGLKDEDVIFIHKSKVKSEQYIKKGDILLAASSGSKDIVGKNIYFEKNYNATFGAFCKLIRPIGNIYPSYLKYFFKTSYYKRHIRKSIQGANINNLKNEHINNLKIPLPTLPEQIKIANILSEVEDLITQRKESINLLDELVKNTFYKMFGDLMKNEKGWERTLLKNLISIKHGFAFKSEYFRENGDYILLTPGNFYEKGGYKIRSNNQKYYTGIIPNEYVLTKGDLLIAMTEQAPGLLGSTIIIPESNKFLHNQRLGLIIFKGKSLNSLYLYHFFNNEKIRKTIHSKATGTKVRHTSPSKLEEILIPNPPIELQNQFAKIVEEIEEIKNHYQQSLKELESLFGVLSQKAFKGELDLSKMEIEVEDEYLKKDSGQARMTLEDESDNLNNDSKQMKITFEEDSKKVSEKKTSENFETETFDIIKYPETDIRSKFHQSQSLSYDENGIIDYSAYNPDLKFKYDNLSFEYLHGIIMQDQLKGKFTFKELEDELKSLSKEKLLTKKKIKEIIVEMLENEPPFLEQIYDYSESEKKKPVNEQEKQVMFKVLS